MTGHNPAYSSTNKVFTVKEARAALPYVRRITADVVETYARIIQIRRASEHEPENYQDDYWRAMDKLGALIDELHAAGVELKDYELGLIDFPASLHGTNIYLCWKHGEPEIKYFHFVDEGLMARKVIDFE